MIEEAFELAIVGGGPAGQAAAERVIAAGLSVVMIDEQARMGGQILRQPPTAMRISSWLPGRSYRRLKALLARAEALPGLDWRGRTSVVGVLPGDDPDGGFVLLLAPTDGGPGTRVTARRLLVAAGCYDLPVPLPGWTTPGVMSAGAIQAFVKSQQLVPGARFVLCGTHPLQLVLADQIVAGGGTVAALLFARTRAIMIRVLARHPLVAMRHAGVLVDAAAAYVRLIRSGVPVRFGRTVSAVEGDGIVTGVRIEGADERIACDRVGLCFGFVPQADLPRSLGAAADWARGAGGWATRADAWQRTDRPALYVAGETTGVAGAAAAVEEGTIAGTAILLDSGYITVPEATAQIAPHRRRLRSLRRFARLLDAIADPGEIIADLPDADTIVCRCEDVTRAAIEDGMDGVAGPGTASALKLVTRAGMGLCQGRGCEAAVLRIVAQRLGRDAGSIGGFTPRLPVRPTPIGSLRG